MERVDQPNDRSVGADQDRLAVLRELQAGPVAFLLLVQQECHERTLVEGPQVVQLDGLGVDAGGEDQTFGIEGGDGTSLKVHHALAVRTPQVPDPQGLVQRAGDESVVDGRNVQRRHLLGVAGEVPQVLVVMEAQVTDRVVDLRRAVDRRRVAVSEVNQVHAVLLGVDGSRLCSLLAVVEHNLVIVAAAVKARKDPDEEILITIQREK